MLLNERRCGFCPCIRQPQWGEGRTVLGPELRNVSCSTACLLKQMYSKITSLFLSPASIQSTICWAVNPPPPSPDRSGGLTVATAKETAGPSGLTVARAREAAGPAGASVARAKETAGPAGASVDRARETAGPGGASVDRAREAAGPAGRSRLTVWKDRKRLFSFKIRREEASFTEMNEFERQEEERKSVYKHTHTVHTQPSPR